jgi:hypothetical protein
MSRFTDRLWQELMREHRAQLEAIDRPAAERRRRALPRLLAGTTVGLAGVGTAIALAIGAASSTPAFAVTKNPDGTVSVTINKLAGVAGANRKLAQFGVRAVAVPIEAGCAAAPPVAARAMAAKIHAAIATGGTVRIDPRQIPAGKRLVLAAAAAPAQVRIWKLRAAVRAMPPCFKEVSAAGGCGVTVFPGPPGQPGTSTTSTDTTGTTTAPPTTAATTPTTAAPTPTTAATTPAAPTTTTTTTGTGATTAPGPPGRGVECQPPPCAAGIASASSTTTTNTTTTATGTTTGPQTPPAPGHAWFRCGPPPFCAPGRVTAIPPTGASDNAAIERKLEALRRARAALAAQLARERAKKH